MKFTFNELLDKVKYAYTNMGLIPTKGKFLDNNSACAVGALAYDMCKSAPWVDYQGRQLVLWDFECSTDWLDGFIGGFDADKDLENTIPLEFCQGYSWGRQIAKEIFEEP